MNLTIVGAGAIGGTIGAYMARSGQAVQLVDMDAAHVRAMQTEGLTIRGFAETFTVPVNATTPDALNGPLDIVFLAVKAQHTREALAPLLPLLRQQSTVVSLQNGLCERIIAEEIGTGRTVGAFVNFSADYLQPGIISYGGSGTLCLGELDGHMSERLEMLRDLLAAWGPVTPTANIWGYLWGKMAYGNMLFATALADDTMAEVIDRYRALMVELASEVYEVAEREGVAVEPFDNVDPRLFYPPATRDAEAIRNSLDQLVARRRRDQKSKSGIWRDLAVRHRKTEVDQQIGLVARIGKDHGLPMPLTNRLVTMIHELEEQQRVMSWENLDELDGLRAGFRKDAGPF